jgi:CMP-N-acetylneuraminate monooxygenase
MDHAGKKLLYAIDEDQLNRGVTFVNDGNIIAYKDERGSITATANRCKHQGHQFKSTTECILTCPGHGWQLDLSIMRYQAPVGGLKQEELIVERTSDRQIRFYESGWKPWELMPPNNSYLSPEEYTIRFYAHACIEVSCASVSFFTDPWLVGPAFTRGWWLTHQPPSDWVDRLASATGIYISHNHSDHLNLHTLRRVAAYNPAVPIFVPDFQNNYCLPLLEKAGLRNLNVTEFDSWVPLGDAARFVILKDGTGRSDSGVLVEYKGHRILNTVDCQNLNNGRLPNVDVLLSAFAGGASGYPVCWEGYSQQCLSELMRKKRESILVNVLKIVERTNPKIYIPFAGYFTEAHPADADIKRLNVKNTPDEVCKTIRERYPNVQTWIPSSGAVLDVGQLTQVSDAPSHTQCGENLHDYEPYLDEIRQSREFPPLKSEEGLRQYFAWAGFRGNVVLHVIETDESFYHVVREFYLDFRDLTFSYERPARDHTYLRIRCRSDVFRFVLQHGLPWEEFSIGFQARFYREPDIYNFEFWDHFQNKLPISPPAW